MADLIKEKTAEKSAKKVEAKAEEIIVDKAVKKAVENNASMQILANINMATVSGAQIAPNTNSEPSNVIQKNIVNEIDEVTHSKVIRSYDQLVGNWDSFINNVLNLPEPEAYSMKLTMLNNIIATAEREDRSFEANMWKCRKL